MPPISVLRRRPRQRERRGHASAAPVSTAMTDDLRLPSRSHGNGRLRRAERALSTPVLSTDESAVLRDRLLGEIAGLESGESATNWAQGALAAKNRLSAEDAKQLEEAFEKQAIRALAVRKR